MYLKIGREVHYSVLKLFKYEHDEKQYQQIEHWTSHADAVEKGETFKDDCDGFALTCADLLIRKGVPKDKISIVYCLTEGGGGHLVCGLYTDGTTYILDNRYDKVYPWESMDYTWKYFMKFDSSGKWYKVEA